MERAGEVGAVRFLHVAPDAGTLDVYLDGQMPVPGISYGQITGYFEAGPALRRLRIYARGTEGRASPLLEAGIETPDPAGDSTLVIVGALGDLDALLLDDTAAPPPLDRARVRLVHASPAGPPVEVRMRGGAALFGHVEFPQATHLQEVDAGLIDIELRPEGGSRRSLLLPDHRLAAGSVQTLVLIGRFRGTPPLAIMPLVQATESRRPLL